MTFASAFSPNRAVSRGVAGALALAWAASFFALWSLAPFDLLSSPLEVLRAFAELLRTRGLVSNLLSSMYSNAAAVAWAAVLSLGLAYLGVLPLFRPLATFVGKVRFWGFTGVSVVFTLLFHGGHELKVSLLSFGIMGFFLTSMCDEIRSIPEDHFDYARTLGMSEGRLVWEVVVLGTLDRAFDILRQNAAMGWTLLTMVETLIRSEGGIGVLLANQNKHMDLASVAALQAVVFAVGIAQDYAIGVVKGVACPYAALKLARR